MNNKINQLRKTLTQSDIDASIRMFGGEMSGRDLGYIRHNETRRTVKGIYFERVWHIRKDGVPDSAKIPRDYIRIIPAAEIEAMYAPYIDNTANFENRIKKAFRA